MLTVQECAWCGRAIWVRVLEPGLLCEDCVRAYEEWEAWNGNGE